MSPLSPDEQAEMVKWLIVGCAALWAAIGLFEVIVEPLLVMAATALIRLIIRRPGWVASLIVVVVIGWVILAHYWWISVVAIVSIVARGVCMGLVRRETLPQSSEAVR